MAKPKYLTTTWPCTWLNCTPNGPFEEGCTQIIFHFSIQIHLKVEFPPRGSDVWTNQWPREYCFLLPLLLMTSHMTAPNSSAIILQTTYRGVGCENDAFEKPHPDLPYSKELLSLAVATQVTEPRFQFNSIQLPRHKTLQWIWSWKLVSRLLLICKCIELDMERTLQLISSSQEVSSETS